MKSRPAETGGLAAAVAFLIARAVKVDNDATMTALVVVVGAVPAVITWLVVKFRKP